MLQAKPCWLQLHHDANLWCMQAVQKSSLGPIRAVGASRRKVSPLLLALGAHQWQVATPMIKRMATTLQQHHPALQDALGW